MATLRQLLSHLPFRYSGKDTGNGSVVPPSSTNLVQNLQQTVFQVDLLGELTYLSQSWLRLTGRDPQTCLNTSFLKYIHPADRERYRIYFERIMLRARDTSHHANMRLICSDGNFCWVVMQANPVLGKEANPRIQGIAGTLNDITEHMHGEELRDARYRSLQNLVNNLSGVVYRYRNDRTRTMEYISEGCRTLLGCAPQDLINNRKLTYTDLIHEADRQPAWDQVQEAIEQNRPFTISYRLRNVDGNYRWVRDWGRGLVSDSGVLLKVEGIIADLSAQKADLAQQQSPETPASEQ